ncbi:MAG: acyl-CoA ligase (AMP-forming), exosortase A system-associated [Chitinivibrionales bacterium]|nr:acyl-CoA ligase (AMP-forming), exosortase A system-associated [Chitinivibrionales bacterium]
MDYLLHHLLTRAADRWPDAVAVADSRGELSYRELAGRAGLIADALRDAGIQRSDRVAFFLDHCVDQAVTVFAVSHAGGVFVPVNNQLYPDQLRHIVNDAEATVLITNRERLARLGDVLPSCSALRHVLCIEDLQGESTFWRCSPAIESDLAAILYTSGSTGRPKGVMLSHRNLLSGSSIVSEYLELTHDERLLGILPLSFDYGLNQLITMVENGGAYRFFTFLLPNDIVNALQRYAITGLAGVPSLWALLARSSLGREPLPHLRRITNSGGAMPTTILAELRRRMPDVKVYLMYGLTEAFRSTYLPPAELEQRPKSIGKAIPNTEITVLSEAGAPCGPNEKGILVHRGPTVALGYWRRPDETAERFRTMPLPNVGGPSVETVVYSGDLVSADEDGYLYFIGRTDAMIKSSGYRISPSEIEEIVFRSGMAGEAAAIGIGDDALGQRVKVLMVPLPKAPPDAARRVKAYCAEHMPAYMVPSMVEFVDSLPKTPVGKVDYPALYRREEAARAAGSEPVAQNACADMAPPANSPTQGEPAYGDAAG